MRRLVRGVVVVLAVTFVAGAPAALTAATAPASQTPASETPARPAADPDGVGGGTTAFESLPVEVEIDRLTPSTPSTEPDGTFEIGGWLRNRTGRTISDITLRLGIGSVLAGRSGLAAADREPVTASRDFAPAATIEGKLRPGGSVPFTYRTPVSEISASLTGVYPIRLVVEGDDRGRAAVVGSVQTFLPWYAEVPQHPTVVAWVWPVTGPPVLTATGDTLRPERLFDQLEPGGRLDALVGAGATLSPGTVTLAVDGSVVAAAAERSRATGAAGAQSREWLAALRTAAAAHPVLPLPYGDVDTVGARAAGIPDADAVAAGEATLAAALGTPGDARLAWPADGLLDPESYAEALAAGATGFALTRASLPGVRETYGTRIPPVSAVPLDDPRDLALPDPGPDEAPQGPAALVVDATLGELAALAPDYPGGDRLAEQRIAAEIAQITAGASGAPRVVVVAPPRVWAPSEALARRLHAATTGGPWARAATLPAILAEPGRTGSSEVVLPRAAMDAGVAPETLDRVRAAAAAIERFADVLAERDREVVLGPYVRAAWSGASNAWRDAPAQGEAYAARLEADVADLADTVAVASSGNYSLSGAAAALPVTISNRLSVPATVRLAVDAPAVAGLTVTDPGPIIVPGGRLLTVSVPVTLDRPGSYRLEVGLATPSGAPLGEPVPVVVRSTAYDRALLVVTVSALAMFVVLAVVRWVRLQRQAASGTRRSGRTRPPEEDR